MDLGTEWDQGLAWSPWAWSPGHQELTPLLVLPCLHPLYLFPPSVGKQLNINFSTRSWNAAQPLHLSSTVPASSREALSAPGTQHHGPSPFSNNVWVKDDWDSSLPSCGRADSTCVHKHSNWRWGGGARLGNTGEPQRPPRRDDWQAWPPGTPCWKSRFSPNSPDVWLHLKCLDFWLLYPNAQQHM